MADSSNRAVLTRREALILVRRGGREHHCQ